MVQSLSTKAILPISCSVRLFSNRYHTALVTDVAVVCCGQRCVRMSCGAVRQGLRARAGLMNQSVLSSYSQAWPLPILILIFVLANGAMWVLMAKSLASSPATAPPFLLATGSNLLLSASHLSSVSLHITLSPLSLCLSLTHYLTHPLSLSVCLSVCPAPKSQSLGSQCMAGVCSRGLCRGARFSPLGARRGPYLCRNGALKSSNETREDSMISARYPPSRPCWRCDTSGRTRQQF